MSPPTHETDAAPTEELVRRPEIVGVLMVVVGCTAAVLVGRSALLDEPAPAGTCEEILRRYAEARLRQADPQPSPSALAAHRAAALERAERSRRFARCPQTLTSSAAACALAAHDADQIERCLQ